MSSTEFNLKNINFMSETKYNSLTQINDDELYAVKVNGINVDSISNQNQNEDNIKFWTGTKEEYDALTPETDTIYSITDDTDVGLMTLLSEVLYPIGSIYMGVMNVCPLSALFGTWTLVSTGKVLQGSDNNHNAGSTIAPGLPNITGVFGAHESSVDTSGAFYKTSGGECPTSGYVTRNTYNFDASRSNSIYGNSTTVQPPAYVVNIWQRTA